MNNFYDADFKYTMAKEEQLNKIRPNSDEVEHIRQQFKVLTGKALRAFFEKHNITEIGSRDNAACWCQIAAESQTFDEAVHMLDCIMFEMVPKDEPCIDLDLRKRTAKSKSELNSIFLLARNEAKIIRQLYNRVAQYDPTYDGNREYRKIRKALVFMKRAILACVYSKLPTILTTDEYEELQQLSGHPDVAAKRYRYNEVTREYNRIGGLPRKRAYRLFGINGCSVFVKKALHRYEVMLEALHR